MRLVLLMLASALTASVGAEPMQGHLNDPLSPMLTPADRRPDESDGIWLPNSYGGVTGVVLDLARVGTDEMLRVRLRTQSELRPWLGAHYKVQSDRTSQNKERGTKERTVVLVDNDSLRQWGRRQIICYKILHQEDRATPEGIKLTSEATHYSLTISEIENEHEVLYLIRLGKSFPNAEHPNLTRPPAGEPGGENAPTKPVGT